mgnify:CR=1 FL=1
MATDFNKLQQETKKTIESEGSILTIIRKDVDYDPSDLSTAETKEEETTYGISLGFNSKYVRGTLVQAGDVRLMIPGDLSISKEEEIILNGQSYEIVSVFKQIQGNVVLYQEILIRS